MVEKSKLPNGIRILVAPMAQVQSVTVLVLLRTGSRFETKENNGVSHFLEHMIFKGTKKRPTSVEISTLLDSIGGVYNAFTSKEYTGFYVKAAASELDLVLDVLSDMVNNSLFKPEEMDRERKVIIEEINMYEDDPQSKVGEVYEALVYPNNSLGWPISGFKEVIAKMDRDTISDWFERHYRGSSMVISVAGGVKPKEIEKKLEKFFGYVDDGERGEFKKFVDQQSKPASDIFFKQTDQAHLIVGTRSYPRSHPDRYALSLLSMIFGGSNSSRLFREVRVNRGLAYYVGSIIDRNFDCGNFLAYAGVNINAISEAIKVIIEQFTLMSDKGAQKEELERVKKMWKGQMILSLEDSQSVASWYANRELLEDKIETPEEVMKKIDAVKLEEIQKVAKDIFKTEKLSLAVVGPFKEKDKFDRLLKI